MYQTIYELLNKTGLIKSAVILNGRERGQRCILNRENCIVRSGPEMDWKPYLHAISAEEETKVISVGGTKILVELFEKNPRLVILGGGHVSCPVAHIAKMLDFHVTVMDDRKEFLTKKRFPEADERIYGSFEELSEKIPPYANTYYVVITRGHEGDAVCARQILKRPYVYFGMIGSRTKVKLTREKLLGEGFSEAQMDSVHAPIGLPIGGQLPEEIAISIMAEIVQTKNLHYRAFTDEKVAGAVAAGGHGTMMTIIEKSGSSPRGVGSRMFLKENGMSYGSIGGGSVEYEAMKYAAMVKGTEIREYHLSVNDDRNLGMICGGSVKVLFEKI
mgnify:CR=1 FL=1